VSSPFYPAVCSHCGAPVVGGLVVDPTIPVYGCAHAGYAHMRMALEELEARDRIERNVVELDGDDLLPLLELADATLESIGVVFTRARQ
jgi:hypothetical protein